jgi:DNA-binding MarR family transcriptional regulator
MVRKTYYHVKPMTTNEIPMTPMLGALLRGPSLAIVARIAAELAEAGLIDLRPAHFAVFQQLPREGARLTAIAERAQMTKQSMGALVEHLVDTGYLTRVADPSDGRAQIIQRTERGWEVERIARASIQHLEDEWGAALGHERMQQLRGTLEDLAAIISARSHAL